MEVAGLIFTIIGVFVSVYAIYYSKLLARSRRNEVTIFHQHFEAVQIPEHSVENHLYRATLINSGELEIDESHFVHDLAIQLPEPITSVEITDRSTKRLTVKQQVEGDSILLRWDLMKPKDYFRYQVSSQGKPLTRNAFLKSMKTDNRIKGFLKINLIEEKDWLISNRSNTGRVWLWLIGILLVAVTIPTYSALLNKAQPLRDLPSEIPVITLPARTDSLKGSAGDTVAIAEYSWAKISGPAAAGIQQVSKVDIVPLKPQVYTFELKVTDSQGNSSTDQVTVTVNPNSKQPQIFAVQNQNGQNLALVTTNTETWTYIAYSLPLIFLAFFLIRVALKLNFQNRMRLLYQSIPNA